MSRATYAAFEFRCLRCSSDEQMRINRELPLGDPERHPVSFKARFWTASEFRGKPLTPTFRDLRCPYCGANAAWFERYPRMCASFILPLREDLRPLVFRSVDSKGREHYRYPATNDRTTARANEEPVDFPTLRALNVFLKEQNPGYRDWQVSLNDILDWDESHIDISALDTTDPGAAEDAEAVDGVDDFGVLDESEVPKDVPMSFVDSIS